MSRTFEEYIQNLAKIISCLKQADLNLHPKKCNLFKKKASFLGHVFSADGIATDPEKLESVTKWPVPKYLKQVRSFLAFAHTIENLYRNLLI